MSDDVVLVTGATGNTGSGVVGGLLARGIRVRGLVRDAARGEGLKSLGAELAIGDLDNPASLNKGIFDGVTRAYVCTWNGPTALDQWMNLHDALDAAGASPSVVRLSAFGTPRSRIIEQLAEAEEDLKRSGFAWTILRPTFFMQNTMSTAQSVKEQGTVYFDWGEGKAGMIDLRDVVDSAIGALTATDGRFEGETFLLTGPKSIGFAEVAEGIGKAIGKDVKYVPVPHEAVKQVLVDMGFPEWIADGFVELAGGFENNFADRTTDSVLTLAGHAPRSFEQFARDFADVWRA